VSTSAWARAAPTTTAVLVLLTAAHAGRLAAGRPSLASLCLDGPAILHDPYHQAYRLASSALTHAGWLHLGFNAAALGPLLSRREAAGGGAGAVGDLAGLVLAGGLLFLGATAAAPGLGLPTPGCAVGISGAIFGLMTASPSPAPAVLAGGALTVPGRAYPWALIAALQFLMPGLSAAGHVCGALAGEALGAGRRWGWLADPWGDGGGGSLPTTAGPPSAGAPAWRARMSAFFRRGGGEGADGWTPLPAGEAPSQAASAAEVRAAAAAAAEARAAAAAGR